MNDSVECPYCGEINDDLGDLDLDEGSNDVSCEHCEAVFVVIVESVTTYASMVVPG